MEALKRINPFKQREEKIGSEKDAAIKVNKIPQPKKNLGGVILVGFL